MADQVFLNKMNVKRFRPVLIIVVVIWVLDTLGQVWGASYNGVVLDAETSKPIEGAVAIVVWWKKPLITMNGPQYAHKVKEMLTDAAGKFNIDASPGLDWNPFTYVLWEPTVAIYYPGYTPFPRAYLSIGIEKTIALMLKEGAVVKLPRLKTREERIDFTDPGSIGLNSVPNHRMPALLRLMNLQRKRMGLDPMY